MKYVLGVMLGIAGGLSSLLLAGISDMGQITVPALAFGLLGSAILLGTSYALIKPFVPMFIEDDAIK